MTLDVEARQASPITAAVSAHPVLRPEPLVRYLEGITLAEMADRAGIERGHWAAYRATITVGDGSWEVPSQHWTATRPHGGAIVEIVPIIQGPAVAAIGSALITSLAPSIASAVLGAGASTLALSLATAAISIVATLAINALIQPPTPDIGDTSPFYGVGAPRNQREKYVPVNFPVGRHLSYPQPAASGYAETRDDRVVYHGLFVLGYGPLGVSQPRFGTNDLSDFEDVSLEFRNIDEAYTAPHMTGIDVVGYRGPTEQMTLYPGNISQDDYNVKFEEITPTESLWIQRTTRVDTIRASLVIHFPQGLFKSTREGEDRSRERNFEFEYRLAGTTTWIAEPRLFIKRRRRTAFTIEKEIEFPAPGEYEVRARVNKDSDNDSVYDDAFLIAIRSERAGDLPLNPELAMVAIRIRASKQLNGGIDRLNFMLQQFARQWDGTQLTDYQPVNHPAWSYSDALIGKSAGEKAISEDLIDWPSLKAWQDNEPHWRCDLLVRGKQQVQQLLRTICAAGRARDTFYGTSSGVVRETAGNPVEALLTPRNSFGFKAEHRKVEEFHAIRVKALSERLEWEQDEIIVYRDGWDFATASKFLELTLTGIVIGKNDENLDNLYRLARYFMAELLLRPETVQVSVDLTHLALQLGSKIRFQHDVRLNGVGSGRIREIVSGTGTTAITLDERIETPPDSYRLSVWNSVNELTTTTATQDAVDPAVWITDTDIDASIALDDLVIIERTTDAERDLIVTRIEPQEEDRAVLYCVDAAPEILTADQGAIPPYDPGINTDLLSQQDGPALPEILGLRSDLGSALIPRANTTPLPRIGIATRPPRALLGQAVFVQMRWREEDDANWTISAAAPYAPEVFSDPVEEGARYEAEIQFLDSEGRSRGYVPAGFVTASVSPAFIFAPAGWIAEPGIDTIKLSGNASTNEDFAEFRVYGLVADGQPEVFVADSRDTVIVVRPDPAQGFTGYVVREAMNTGALSAPTAFLPAVPAGVDTTDLTAVLNQRLIDAEDDAAQALGDIESIEQGLNDIQYLAAVTTPEGKIAALKIGTFLDPNGTGGAALTFDGSILATGTVGARAFVVSDFSGNLAYDNPFFTGDRSIWGGSSNYTLEPRTPGSDFPTPFVMNVPAPPVGTNFGATISDRYPVEFGTSYHVSFDVLAEPTARIGVRARFTDENGDFTGAAFIRMLDPSPPSPTSWTRHQDTFSVFTGSAVEMQFQIFRQDISGDTQDAKITNVVVRKQASASTVILPDSVTTDLVNTQDFFAAGVGVFGGALQSANLDKSVSNPLGYQLNQDGSAFFGSDVEIRGALRRSSFINGELQTILPNPEDVRVLRQTVIGFQFDLPGFIEIWLIGAGASGGAAHGNSAARATGGGAGGAVRAFLEIADTSDLYNITLGLGGAGVTAPNQGTSTGGFDGGDSTFIGPGLDLFAAGGKRGRALIDDKTSNVPNGLGGTASGGFAAFKGGDGGQISTSVTNDAAASGGGSINAGLLEGIPDAPDFLVNTPGDADVEYESEGGFPLIQNIREMKLSPFPPMYYDDTNWTGSDGRSRRRGSGTLGITGRPRPYGSGTGGTALSNSNSNSEDAVSGDAGNAVAFIYYHTGRPI
ncbi:glycine-rich domain-containing protein [Aestuariibius sp. 2305UL40-4]|uniref:glycine-rich domain-containing protein n=1 Tax=Aestuariibius violaceus TaxID=3234132 RepID=UPI00345EAE16